MSDRVGVITDRVVAAFHRGDSDEIRAALGEISQQERIGVMFELFNRRELAVIAASRAPDSRHDMRPMGFPGMGVYHGPDGYLAFQEEWMEAFDHAELVLHETAEHGSHYFFIGEQTMRGGGSGVEVGFHWAGYGEIEDGLISWSVFDRDLERARARYNELVAAS